ncbi:MAG: hypothetical protein ABR584_10630 [Candidatus Baltobacteraceae bacterium]
MEQASMMERWQRENNREGAGLAASLLLHALLFAWLLPQLAISHAPALESVETISFQKIEHVSMQRAHAPATAKATVALARASRAARVKKPTATHANKPSPPPSARSRDAKKTQPPGSLPKPVALAQENGTPAPDLARPALRAAAPVRSTPAAVTQQVAAASGTTNGGGNGIFLNTDAQAPVLDANASSELKRRFRINITLTVLVTDDGKTKDVTFNPPAGAEIEKQIRQLLSSAHWDAAQCGGGIACEGQVTIKLFQ